MVFLGLASGLTLALLRLEYKLRHW